MLNYAKISELLLAKISGEWGTDPTSENSVSIIRSTNFTNEGRLNLNSIVQRAIPESKIKAKKLLLGDVIIEKSGGSPTQPVGRVVYFNINDGKEYLCNNFTSILRPTLDVYPKYLFYSLYFLHQSKKTLRYQNKTTGIINLQLDRYLNSEKIRLPSMDEQKEISKQLDLITSIRHKRAASVEILNQYIFSKFIEMFGDPQINPLKWECQTLNDVCEEIYRYPTFYGFEYSNDGVPVVKIGNILKNGIVDPDLRNYSFISDEISLRYPRTILELYDILMAVRGDGSTVKRIGLVTSSNLVGANMSPNLLRFKTNKNKLLPHYLFALITSPQGQLMFQKYITQTAKKTITAKDIKQIAIPIPSVKLQDRFTSIVIETERIKEKMINQSLQIENQFQSLMQRSFSAN